MTASDETPSTHVGVTCGKCGADLGASSGRAETHDLIVAHYHAEHPFVAK